MSPDEKVLYGYSISSDDWLEIPEGVETYDNLFIHEENQGVRTVQIPATMEHIHNLQNPFGFNVENYKVSEANESFSDGILFDRDMQVLVLFPSGRGSHINEVLEMCGDEIIEELSYIGEYAFYMKGFIRALILAPWVHVEENSFFIKDGRGKIIANRRLEGYFKRLEENGQISGTQICFYDQGE